MQPQKILIRRHSLLVRITHWINVLCILVLVMSGLQIFNAHPALYIGQASDFDNPVLTPDRPQHADRPGRRDARFCGVTLQHHRLPRPLHQQRPRCRRAAFPSWLTLPSYQDLATGRRWHFFFAWLFVINGAVYVIASLLSRHVWRDLVPCVARDPRHRPLDHRPHPAPLRSRPRLQRAAEARPISLMIFVVLPLIILAGMTMSPGLNAAFPWLVDLFGGRQTARTIHFIAATAIVLFVIVHVVMVLISGVWNNIRSMITGRYAIIARGDAHDR